MTRLEIRTRMMTTVLPNFEALRENDEHFEYIEYRGGIESNYFTHDETKASIIHSTLVRLLALFDKETKVKWKNLTIEHGSPLHVITISKDFDL